MKISKREGGAERRILIGMITDRCVLSKLASKWQKDLFRSKWANLVGSWCVTYFHKYGKAPNSAIEGLFEAWASKATDKETVELVERFLEGLSGEYTTLRKELNAPYLLDLAATHFNAVRLQRLKDQLEGDLDSGKLDDADKRVSQFKRIEIGQGVGVDVFADRTALEEAFAARGEPLIRYKGALGNFFKNTFERDALVSFMGPEKRGKTFWLLDVAWRGVEQGRRVAFFSVGDMSQSQVLRRLVCRAAKQPLDAGVIRWPTFIERDGEGGEAVVTHEERTYEEPLDVERSWAALSRFAKKRAGGDTRRLRLSCYPNSTLSADGLAGVLQDWEREEWVPDIVCVDYADILAPPSGYTESRDQINATWKRLRALSQSLHCCVVTATQSNAASYKAGTVDMSNFSEDKRKMAHVTAMIGLNQNNGEKGNGVMRLNYVVLREGEFLADQCVHVAQCLPVCHPSVLSTF